MSNMTIKKSTRKQYKKLLSQFKKWAYNRGETLLDLRQDQVNEYELYLINVQNLSPSTVNNHRQAINKFYKAHGIDIRLSLKSNGGRWRMIDTISKDEAEHLISLVSNFYQPILREIYYNLVSPGEAVKKFPSPRASHVSLATVNRKIAIAADKAGISKRVRAKMLQQAGIVHAIEAGKSRDWIFQQANIKPSTLARYLTNT